MPDRGFCILKAGLEQKEFDGESKTFEDLTVSLTSQFGFPTIPFMKTQSSKPVTLSIEIQE